MDVTGVHRNAAATTSRDVHFVNVSVVNLPEEVSFVQYVHRPGLSLGADGARDSPLPGGPLSIKYINLILKEEREVNGYYSNTFLFSTSDPCASFVALLI